MDATSKLFKYMQEKSTKSYFIQEMMKRRLVEHFLQKTIQSLSNKCEQYKKALEENKQVVVLNTQDNQNRTMVQHSIKELKPFSRKYSVQRAEVKQRKKSNLQLLESMVLPELKVPAIPESPRTPLDSCMQLSSRLESPISR